MTSDSAEAYLDRKMRALAPAVEQAARAGGVLPPLRWHMVQVTRDQEINAGHSVINAGIHDAAFEAAKVKIGATEALMMVFPDQEARCSWVIAVDGVRAPIEDTIWSEPGRANEL